MLPYYSVWLGSHWVLVDKGLSSVSPLRTMPTKSNEKTIRIPRKNFLPLKKISRARVSRGSASLHPRSEISPPHRGFCH